MPSLQNHETFSPFFLARNSSGVGLSSATPLVLWGVAPREESKKEFMTKSKAFTDFFVPFGLFRA
jgi:hypothetical protein